MITHDYSLQVIKDSRTPVGDAVDLSLRAILPRGVEALRWRSFLAGRQGLPQPLQVSPRWSKDLGTPVVSEILMEAGEFSVALPAQRVFQPAARGASSTLVEQGLLADGDPYCFLVTARPTASSPTPPVFSLDDYPVVDAGAEATGETIDAEFAAPGDFVVSISRTLLEDAARLAESGGEAETGGVLFGRLVRDGQRGDAVLEVTHLCAASGGRGDHASFTFTPDTWTHAQTALAERPAGDIMVGSYHSHPDFCKNCEPSRQKNCTMRKPFFSDDDVHLHETVFPAAYSVGLLMSHDGASYVPSLWGWRDGFVTRRSYLIHS